MFCPWIMMIRGDDGAWVKGTRFLTREAADRWANEFEATYGNRTEVLCSW